VAPQGDDHGHARQARELRDPDDGQQSDAAGLKPAAEVGRPPEQGGREPERYRKQLVTRPGGQARLPRPYRKPIAFPRNRVVRDLYGNM
jgi:hypothetical protein